MLRLRNLSFVELLTFCATTLREYMPAYDALAWLIGLTALNHWAIQQALVALVNPLLNGARYDVFCAPEPLSSNARAHTHTRWSVGAPSSALSARSFAGLTLSPRLSRAPQ